MREKERERETDMREREMLKKKETQFFMEWSRLETGARQSRVKHMELFSMTFRETEICVWDNQKMKHE